MFRTTVVMTQLRLTYAPEVKIDTVMFITTFNKCGVRISDIGAFGFCIKKMLDITQGHKRNSKFLTFKYKKMTKSKPKKSYK